MNIVVMWLRYQSKRNQETIRRRKRGGIYHGFHGRKDWRASALQRDWRFYGPEDFVLHHGRCWKPQPLPPGYRIGKLGDCGRNACRLALRRPDLTYVEGYAIAKQMASWENYLGHSWVVDQERRVIDPTWPEGGVEYFGVPFETSYVASICKKSPTPTLIERWWDDFPLLRVPGTRPKAWYSKRFDHPMGPGPFRRIRY